MLGRVSTNILKVVRKLRQTGGFRQEPNDEVVQEIIPIPNLNV